MAYSVSSEIHRQCGVNELAQVSKRAPTTEPPRDTIYSVSFLTGNMKRTLEVHIVFDWLIAEIALLT